MAAISGWQWKVRGEVSKHRSERAQRGAGVVLRLET